MFKRYCPDQLCKSIALLVELTVPLRFQEFTNMEHTFLQFEGEEGILAVIGRSDLAR